MNVAGLNKPVLKCADREAAYSDAAFKTECRDVSRNISCNGRFQRGPGIHFYGWEMKEESGTAES